MTRKVHTQELAKQVSLSMMRIVTSGMLDDIVLSSHQDVAINYVDFSHVSQGRMTKCIKDVIRQVYLSMIRKITMGKELLSRSLTAPTTFSAKMLTFNPFGNMFKMFCLI